MPSSRPLLIGITGGIGSGKSLITRLFALLGVPVYDADTRARWLMNQHPGLRQEISGLIGPEAYFGDGSLNRAYMAAQVFNNAEKLQKINSMVHPKVGQDFMHWVNQHAHAPCLLKEAALLFESGSYRQLHYTISVVAPVALRIQRVLRRDPHRTEQEVRAIIEKQMSEEERQQRASFLIYNDDSRLVIPQVLALHARFLLGETIH